MTALVVFAHGSSLETANDRVRLVARGVQERGAYKYVEPAFLEMAKPDLPSVVECLVLEGVTKFIVLPYFLTPGVHLKRDLPRIVEELLSIHKGIEIQIAPPLDGHPALGQILDDRAKEALRE